MSSTSKKLLFLLIPLLVILVGCASLLFFLPGEKSDKMYVEQISNARRLADSGDYEQAVVYYRRAINEDDTQVDPYLELSDVYFRMNRKDECIQILKDGYDKTKALRILAVLRNYGVDYDQENTADLQAADKKDEEVSKDVSVNTMYMNVFASYDYEMYSSHYTKTNESKSGNKYVVKYVQFDADFEYADSGSNKIIDSSKSCPYPHARPTAITLNKLGQLIVGIENGATPDQLKNLGFRNIKVGSFDSAHNCYLLTAEYSGLKVTLGSDKDGLVKGEDTYNLIVPPPSSDVIAKVTVNGNITNAKNASPVDNAQVIIRDGKNNKSGSAVETVSSYNGSFSVSLEPGDYTAEVSADGYNNEFFELYVPDNVPSIDVSFTISPSLGANEVRFVLEWGATPPDLDSHLEGTIDNTGINVNYINKQASKNGTVLVDLDVDDQTGYGPETITMHKTNGRVEYKVHCYTTNGSLVNSGAVVKIYTSNSSQPIVVSMPDNVDDKWWTVCTVEDGVVKNINGRQS